MNGTAKVAPYQMNPAEDYVIFGDELREGMWIMREDELMRTVSANEDEQIRMNRFCRVTRLRIAYKGHGPCALFIGEWVDGFQKRFSVHQDFTWIVKRDGTPEPEAELREIAEGEQS